MEEVQPAKAKADYTLSLGDSTVIGNNPSEATLYHWQPTTGLSCPTCANPNASPGVTTTYTVTKTQCKAITTDDIKITIGSVGINELTPKANLIKLYPNPNTGSFSVNIAETALASSLLRMYNVNGQLVHEQQLSGKDNGLYELHVELSNGIYLVEVNGVLNNVHYKQKVVIAN